MSKGACEAFMRCVELAIAMKIPKLPDHEGCWEHKVDDQWFIAMNGHTDKRSLKGRDHIVIEPYTAYVEYNGWPAGLFDYHGGTIAAGEGANENTFIAALVAAKERLQASEPDEHAK